MGPWISNKDTKAISPRVPGTATTSLSTVRPTPGPGVEEGKKETKRRRNQLSCADATGYFLVNRVEREGVQVCWTQFVHLPRPNVNWFTAICPEGALMTKGTRFVLANTEELHAKILDMSERIRQLENAISSSMPGSEPHPLLREDLLLIKVPIEFRNDGNSPPSEPQDALSKDKEAFPTLLDAFGTLKIGADGHSRFFGQTARTEVGPIWLIADETDQPEAPEVQNLLPPDILHLCQAFPFGSCTQEVQLLQLILDFVPSKNEARTLVDIYFTNSAWMYEPCPRTQFDTEVFKHVYEHISDPEGILPHRLALFFAVLSHGVLVDIHRPSYSPFAEQLHQLAKASLAASPFLQEPTLPVIQAMFLIGFYLVLVNRKEAASMGWALQGLNCKLAEMLGLHRDLEYWDAEDTRSHGEARRKVFWELVTLDGWMSLGLGRPATIHFSQIDCKMPAASVQAMQNPKLHTWHTWKHGLAQLLSRVLQKALDPRTPSYDDILEVDRAIHAYAMPADAEALANGLAHQNPQLETIASVMQRWLLVQGRFTCVLLLHRGYFAQALSEKADPMQSRFAPSVLATYRSACYIILALNNVYSQQPALACRFGLFWSNGFSASIALCLIITRATRSSYAPFALGQLDLAYELFQKAAAEGCAPAMKALPIMTRLRDKAHMAYAPYRNGQHPASMVSRKTLPPDNDEELHILGGRTNLIAEPVSSNTASSSNSRLPQLDYPSSPAMVQLPPTNHLDSVHPSLVQYIAQSPTMLSGNQSMHGNIYTQLPQHQHSSTSGGGRSQHTRHEAYNYMTNINSSSSSSLAAAIPGLTTKVIDQNDSQPQQNQYAAWQNYMEQLGLPY
ncbi:hypothetical protein Clacol_006677 [Clathrus columnatus]|uniref:Xylanolytic transcriptional activator regulatory domain-containing protein n=1 Tax=Clathrus columnatus TaxID=1419009 RepID=A0AAV5ADH0_9AGAM|nr:hypothetical protein Clacol_006677 [Clathrus columnatus]